MLDLLVLPPVAPPKAAGAAASPDVAQRKDKLEKLKEKLRDKKDKDDSSHHRKRNRP